MDGVQLWQFPWSLHVRMSMDHPKIEFQFGCPENDVDGAGRGSLLRVGCVLCGASVTEQVFQDQQQ
jgi:hypothetical protein